MHKLLSALALPFLLLGCTDDPLDVAANVDLSRFQGQWYEIAKLPRLTQADCAGTTAFYTLRDDGGVDVVNQCHTGSLEGPAKTARARGVVPDPSVPAKLSVDFGGVYGDYWILEIGERYDYAVIGHPSRDYLWILSRTPVLDAGTLEGALARTKDKGFDTSRLEYTEQAP
jgi:apolipoprotein D and lipocalin family protein